MATPRIEPPRRHYMATLTLRDGRQMHISLGVPHSPWAPTPEERKNKAEANWHIAVGTLNDLELAENGKSSVVYVRSLFHGSMQRAAGVYEQNGKRGMSVEGYLNSWLKLQTHLHEGRRVYQSIINTFCESLPNKGKEEMFQLEPRNIHEFIDEQTQTLRPSTINGKLFMLDKAFEDAVRRGHMLCNIIYEEDYLDEDSLERKPFESNELVLMHERWTYQGTGLEGDTGLRSLEWRRSSKFGAYQGMRLGDAVNQIRANIEFGSEPGKGFITWMPEKTEHIKRVVSLPLHSEMEKELLPFKDSPPHTKLTPLLAQTSRQELCTEFRQELIATGIDPQDHKLKSRLVPAVSFRSHKRYYLNTMEKALVPREILQKLGLHSSNVTSRYLSPWTKKDSEAWRIHIEKVTIEAN